MPSNTQRRSGSSGRRPKSTTPAPPATDADEPEATEDAPTIGATPSVGRAPKVGRTSVDDPADDDADPAAEEDLADVDDVTEFDDDEDDAPVRHKRSTAASRSNAAAKSAADAKTTRAKSSTTTTDAAKKASAARKSAAAKKAGAVAASTRKSVPKSRPGKSTPSRASRKPAPVKAPRPWGMIGLGGVAVLVAVGIIAYGVWYSWDANKPFGERAAEQISGVENYRADNVKWLTRNHKAGKLTYKTTPPVGGDHNEAWENCEGDVYNTQIPNEHAVHSLEHGAVWITYRPGLSAGDVTKLADKVRGKDYLLMSPYPGLDSAVTLQAWGFQLKVDSVSDPRIDEFIKTFRKNAGVESGATCSNGVTATGTEPQAAQPQQTGG